MKIVVCLIDKGEDVYGLRALREREADFIDISDYENGLSDATCTTVKQFIIKEDKVYNVVKTYFDLDNNQRILLAKECTETFDKLVAHSWGDWTITEIPSETTSGTAERICHSEDDHEETAVIPKLTDSSVWSVSSYVPETCDSDGKRIYTSVYGEVEAVVPAKGHKWGEYVITKEPTTSATGSAKRTCSNDESHVEIITLPALTDTTVWTKGASEVPSCLGNGYQMYSSKYGIVKVVIPATGHNFGEYVMTKAPTETATGIATRTCKNNAAHTETTSIPILTDAFWTVSQTVDATCDATGYKIYTSKYGDVKVTIPAIGHKYGAWLITKQPTTDSSGIAQRKCSHDDTHIDEISIPKLTNETTWTLKSSTDATCEKSGHKTYTSIYGDVTITLPAIGHKYGNWLIVNTPTETEAGSVKRVCANDSSHIETKDIPKLTDTTVWTVGSYTPPTCTVTGSRTYNSEYGSITVKIAALGHKYGNWTITTEPTTSMTGTAQRVCANDAKHIETITLPVLTDESVWSIKAATLPGCEVEGSTTFTSIYGDVTIIEDAVGHEYGDWEEVTPATTTSTGLRQKVCKNDPDHIITEEIPMIEEEPLPDDGGDDTPTE